MAGGGGGMQPIFNAQATQLAAALQPANVQMALMVQRLSELVSASEGAGRATGDASKAAKKYQADLMDLAKRVKAGVVSVATTAVGSVTALAGQINQFARRFVEAFRPDVMLRFDRATKDLLATVGEGMVPVVELAIVATRLLGDTLNGVYEAVRPLIDQGIAILGPLLEQLTGFWRDLYGELIGNIVPVLQELLAVFGEYWADVIPVMIQAGMALASAQSDLVTGLLDGLMPAVKALLPLFKLLADVFAGLVPMIVMPIKMLATVVGPLIQLALTPLTVALKVATAVAQPLVAVFTAIAGAVSGVMNELSSLVNELLAAFADIVSELVDVVGELLRPVKDFVDMLVNEFVNAIKGVAKFVTTLIKTFRDFLGLAKPAADLNGSSFGKGASNPQFTSAEAAWRQIVEATAGMGRGTEEKPEERSASALEQIAAWLEQNGPAIVAWLNDRKQDVQNVRRGGEVAARIAAPVPMLLLDALRSTVLRSR